jgi:ABC-type nitrate/sulfonate/bicarbonate transport system permease component
MPVTSEEARQGAVIRATGRWLGKAVFIGLFLLFWAAVAAGMQSVFVPGPVEVGESLLRVALNGDTMGISLVQHSWASLRRVLLGFAIAAAAGIPFGLLLGLNKTLYEASSVITEPLRFIPPLAWAPLAIILMRGTQRYLFIIALGSFFPILLASMTSVARVNPLHLQVAKVFGFGRMKRIFKIVIPSGLPEIVTGLRISLGISWGIIVAAEMVGGGVDGLGRMMLTHAELLQTDVVVVGMILVGVLGFFMNRALLVTEGWLFRWRQEIRL